MGEQSLPKLRVSKEDAYKRIQARIESGKQLLDRNIDSDDELDKVNSEAISWSTYNRELLIKLFDNADALSYADFYDHRLSKDWKHDYLSLGGEIPSFHEEIVDYYKNVSDSIESLEGINERLELYDDHSDAPQRNFANNMVSDNPSRTLGDDVFIVHGHDNEAKETVARFVEKLGIHPIILHEQVDSSQAIIEKLEKHATEVRYAIVLLTPDDVGAAKDENNHLKPRARQNVILELGFFFGALERKNVCVLYKETVELPSDIHGILYVPMNNPNEWQLALAKEMKQAGLPVDMNKLL